MPRYFFNIRPSGALIRDHEEDELPDVAAARELGLEIVQHMLRLPHVYGEIREWQRNEFAITDETGATVLVLPFLEEKSEYSFSGLAGPSRTGSDQESQP